MRKCFVGLLLEIGGNYTKIPAIKLCTCTTCWQTMTLDVLTTFNYGYANEFKVKILRREAAGPRTSLKSSFESSSVSTLDGVYVGCLPWINSCMKTKHCDQDRSPGPA